MDKSKNVEDRSKDLLDLAGAAVTRTVDELKPELENARDNEMVNIGSINEMNDQKLNSIDKWVTYVSSLHADI